MSVQGLYVAPGEGKRLISAAHEVVFKVTGEHSRAASSFEVLVPPGFDVGAHRHAHSEELFYIVEGELEFLAFEPVSKEGHWSQWRSEEDHQVITAAAGSVLFVPPGCAHAFRNVSGRPAKMFFQASPPPDHEHYFEGLIEIFRDGEQVDPAAVAALREKYDIEQLTQLLYEPPAG
ncbi:cupin domain-containing protein [Nocardia concava]|uniref:cupin domain-containing protein n=1 Tax=Nocardia concava TaxID=257281 RepID=UPI0002EA910B|nr:cupin domain-containing protein [Nocardia concava]